MNALTSIAISLFFSTAAFAQTVAVVGSKTIDLKEFNEKYDEVRKNTVNPPPKDLFLEDLVRYELGVQEAIKTKIDKDPQVAERVRQELYKGLVEKKLGKAVTAIEVSEKEMKEYYKSNPEIRTSHILVELKPGATAAQHAEAEKRAKEILKEVRESKRPFEELVNLYTDDVATRKNGGDVGWQTRMTLMPEYYEPARKLKLNQISDLIKTPYGFHIVKLTGVNGYEEANKRQIRAAVFDSERKKMFDKFFADLKKQYTIKVNKDVIK